MYSALDSERIEIVNCLKDTYRGDIKRDVLRGLTSPQKSIPSKYFYDAYGSRLFEEICTLPEYYQTRTELGILRRSADQITRNFREADIIELGSGSNLKIRALLDASYGHGQADIRYVPIDVSESALLGSSDGLLRSYPGLRIVGIVADFTKHIEKIPAGRQRLFVFFGGTIGNFPGRARTRLLECVAEMMGPGDRFLLGIDMVKPVELLERAYNDSKGITAEFNKNILNVVNRELDACFDPAHFDHLAFYVPDKERVEMHLRANRSILVEIRGLGICVRINKDETIRTEICRKFSRGSAEAMAEEAGLRIDRWHSDNRGRFSLVELAGADGG